MRTSTLIGAVVLLALTVTPSSAAEVVVAPPFDHVDTYGDCSSLLATCTWTADADPEGAFALDVDVATEGDDLGLARGSASSSWLLRGQTNKTFSELELEIVLSIDQARAEFAGLVRDSTQGLAGGNASVFVSASVTHYGCGCTGYGSAVIVDERYGPETVSAEEIRILVPVDTYGEPIPPGDAVLNVWLEASASLNFQFFASFPESGQAAASVEGAMTQVIARVRP